MTPPVPPCSVRHPLHGSARAQNAADDIDIHHSVKSFSRHLVNAGGRIDHAGIVDQSAELSERIRLLEQVENVGLDADIALHRNGLAVAGLDRSDDVVGRRLVAGIADHDLVAPLGRSQQKWPGRCRGFPR